MTQPAKSQEPSMEEILASIRRIIADDDASKSSQQTAEAGKWTVAAERPAASQKAEPTPLRAAMPPPSPNEAAERAEAAPPGNPSVDDQSADILDLTESMTAPAEPASSQPLPRAPAEPEPVAAARETYETRETAPKSRAVSGEPAAGPKETADQPAPAPPGDVRLLSQASSAAVDSAFNSLAQTVLLHNARTLDDLVREMLRPMLKAWLDDNLPAMVERLVRAEIERVSRGR